MRLLNDAPEIIVVKILDVLSKITMVSISDFETSPSLSSSSSKNQLIQQAARKETEHELGEVDQEQLFPMTDKNANFALGILVKVEKERFSRSREVFSALIHIHSLNPSLLNGFSRIIRHMCKLQPPEFIFISFALEIDRFVSKLMGHRSSTLVSEDMNYQKIRQEEIRVAKYLNFVSKFVQILHNVLLTAPEASRCRSLLKDCISERSNNTDSERKAQFFNILLKTFAHDCAATISLCLWCGAYSTASSFVHSIDPLDLDLFFYLELDRLIEFIERPLFRHLHLKLLDYDEDPNLEGSSAMLYRLLKSILMILPQSTSYHILQKRLLSAARFRQCAVSLEGMSIIESKYARDGSYIQSIEEVRKQHCESKWREIRSESLEPSSVMNYDKVDISQSRREWLNG